MLAIGDTDGVLLCFAWHLIVQGRGFVEQFQNGMVRAHGDSFAAKRARKLSQRRSVDYTSTVVRYMQTSFHCHLHNLTSPKTRRRPKRVVQCGRCHMLGHSQKRRLPCLIGHKPVDTMQFISASITPK